MKLIRLVGVAITLIFVSPFAAQARVVINELFYNAPEDHDDLQWIELHNTDSRPVDLAGWTLDEGKGFTFPAAARIPGGGFLVVALDPASFTRHYGLPALGPLKRSLQRGGERIELRDARGERVDVARYRDREPWPVSADGYGASLERICATAPGDGAENWGGSPLAEGAAKAMGTPGKANACAAAVLPPVVRGVRALVEDLGPGQALRIEAEVQAQGSVGAVALLYRTVTSGVESAEATLPMTREARTSPYHATLPGQPAGTLIRYRIRAIGERGARRLAPAEHDLRPTYSIYVHEPWEKARLPFGLIVRPGAERAGPEDADALTSPRLGGFGRFRGFDGPRPEGSPPPTGPPGVRPRPEGRPGGAARPNAAPGNAGAPPNTAPGNPGALPRPNGARGPGGPGRGAGRPGGGFRGGPFGRGAASEPRSARGASAFVWVDPATGKSTLFDYVHVIPRARGPMYRGYKLFFQKDRLLNGMSAVNILLEGSEGSMLVEALSYDLYRRVGHAAPLSEFIRLWVDGRMVGYHLMVERPNRSFLRRNTLNDNGDLYKLLWYGQDVVGKHEKKTNAPAGHATLLSLIERLEKSEGEEQWKLIRENFNVDQVATYFAVNMVLSHWDGFFNNYFTYHDTKGSGKWEIYPWDQDQTWGYRGFFGRDEGGGSVFFDMPLNFGMDGARPPGVPPPPANEPRVLERDFGRMFRGGGFGGGRSPGWWRPPGYFSGPLLANPQFRRVFLARTREILEKIYTQETYFPVIDALTERLTEDAALRAKSRGQEEDAGKRQLARNAELLKAHVVKRRQFLLEQEELRALAVAPRDSATRRD